MNVRVVVTRPDGSPIQGATVELIGTQDHKQQDIGTTDNGGAVTLAATGAFFVKPRITGDRHRVLVTNFGNVPCYDYILDGDGHGTHTTVVDLFTTLNALPAGHYNVFICGGDYNGQDVPINLDTGAHVDIFGAGYKSRILSTSSVAGSVIFNCTTEGGSFRWHNLQIGSSDAAYRNIYLFKNGSNLEFEFHDCILGGKFGAEMDGGRFFDCEFTHGVKWDAGSPIDTLEFHDCRFGDDGTYSVYAVFAGACSNWLFSGCRSNGQWYFSANSWTVRLVHNILGTTSGGTNNYLVVDGNSAGRFTLVANEIRPPSDANGAIWIKSVSSNFELACLGNIFKITTGVSFPFITSSDTAARGIFEGNIFPADGLGNYVEDNGGVSISGNFSRSVFGPNYPANKVKYDITGSNNEFYPNSSATGASTPSNDHGGLTGLADDDHTQYALDTDLTTHAAAADPHTGYVLESALNAKGDIYVASADNTVGILSAGTDGHVLTLDSAQALGVKWAAPSGGAGGHTIHDEVAAGLTARTDLHFMGNGVTVVDNAGSTRTEVIIPTVYDAVVDPGDTNAIGKGNVYTKLDDAINAGHETILVRGLTTDTGTITIASGDSVRAIVGDSTVTAIIPVDMDCQKADVLISSMTFSEDGTLANATKLLVTGARVTVFACLFAGALTTGTAAINQVGGITNSATSVPYDTGSSFLSRVGVGPIKIDDEIMYVSAGGNAASGTLTVVRGAHYTLNVTHADNAVITDMTTAALTIAVADVTVVQCRFVALSHDTTTVAGTKKHGQAIMIGKSGDRARIISNVFLANTLFSVISGWNEDLASGFAPNGVQIVGNTLSGNTCMSPLLNVWPTAGVGDIGGREPNGWSITGNILVQMDAGAVYLHHRGTNISGNVFDGTTKSTRTALVNKIGGIASGDTTIPYDTTAGTGTITDQWGIVLIGSEIIIYGSADGTNLNNCIRNAFGTTTPANHADNTTITWLSQFGLINTANNSLAALVNCLVSGNVFATMKVPVFSDNDGLVVRTTYNANIFYSSTAGLSTIYGGTNSTWVNNVWGGGNTLDFMSASGQSLFGGSGNITLANAASDTAIFGPFNPTGVASRWGIPAGQHLAFGRVAGDSSGMGSPYTNRTGAATVLGHVVIVDTANDNSFLTTTTAGDEQVLGVVIQGSVANLSDALIAGPGSSVDVLCNGTIARGDYLKTSTTAGEATTDGAAKTLQSFAIATEARSGAGSSLVAARLL